MKALQRPTNSVAGTPCRCDRCPVVWVHQAKAHRCPLLMCIPLFGASACSLCLVDCRWAGVSTSRGNWYSYCVYILPRARDPSRYYDSSSILPGCTSPSPAVRSNYASLASSQLKLAGCTLSPPPSQSHYMIKQRFNNYISSTDWCIL